MVLDIEKGLNNKKSDYGGTTKYGISQRWHPDVDVPNLTLEGALEIYDSGYWKPAHCEEMPNRLSVLHFDTAIQLSPADAIRMIQLILGIQPDGKWGPTTAKVVEVCQEEAVLHVYLDERKRYYMQQAERDPRQKPNLPGWLNRLQLVRKELFPL